MKRILLIDGENFKGKIRSIFKELGREKLIWHEYDFRGLLDKVLGDSEIQDRIFYFARIKEHEDSKDKSRKLIEEQRRLKAHLEQQKFKVILSGRVRGQSEGEHNKKILIFREKGVDVQIAVDMMKIACDRTADEIILASSDSDLQPAIKEIRARGISCVYLGFETQPNKGLAFTTNRTVLIRNSEIIEHLKISA